MLAFKIVIVWLCAVLLIGCSETDSSNVLTIATTTSTQDSGLMDVLVDAFQDEAKIKVKVVAVGSGQAIRLGQQADVDVLLTHAPDAELKFVQQGHAESRLPVMYNDFVVVGPAEHSELKSCQDVSQVFQIIAEKKLPFISRGDDSGTHRKELKIWEQAGIDLKSKGSWYVQAGDGMAAVLRIASERQALTISDRGTFLAHAKSLDLTICFQGDPNLRNPYSVMVVNRKKHKGLNVDAATRFSQFLVSETGQQLILNFGKDEFGQALFFPE